MAESRLPIHVVGLVQRFDNRYLIRRLAPEAPEAPATCATPDARDTSNLSDRHASVAAVDPAASAATWDFPRGWATPGESAEAAMRRVGAEAIGAPIEVDVGQPPLAAVVDGQRAELRYFFCGIAGSWRDIVSATDVAWVDLAELAALPKHLIHQQVVAWLTDHRDTKRR